MNAAADRFWRKVAVSGSCWSWGAGLDVYGYGKFKVRGHTVKAHRWAYEHLVGPIPDGLVIDHLCRNRACVNPDHLQPVTAEVNIRRGMSPAQVTIRTGICKRGHELTAANTIVYRGSGARTCRTCRNDWQRLNYRAKAVGRA